MNDRPSDPPAVYTEGTSQSFSPPALNPTPGDPALAVALSKAEIDSAIATARAFPRDLRRAANTMMQMATFNPSIAEDCIYSLPRGGKQIRGPSIRFAEIIRHAWGHSRNGARVTFVDRIDRFVECEAIFHDLETNVATTASVRRTIELKRGRSAIDLDMVQLAGAAGMSIARRNAILGGIPRFIWQPVVDQVERVIRGDEKTLSERRERAVAYWAKTGIGVERVLKALARETFDDINLDDLVTMTGWRTAITQGDSTLDELFPEERKAAGKATLDQQLATLAEAPASPGAGEASIPPDAPPIGSEGASPNPAPAEAKAKAAGVGPPAAEAPEALTKATGGQERDKARTAPAKAGPGASGPDKAGAAASERRAALLAQGEAKAQHGNDALMEWLDQLSGDATALITPAMEKRWKELSEGK